MKIVFFGSSEFAVPSLARLSESQHKVIAVVTQPDRKKGRHRKMQPTAIKELALSRGLSIHQPERAAEPSSIKFLKSLKADLFVVVSFGQILSRELLDIPKLYSINLHASLLPKYRGAAPINWAVINGETKAGLTIIKMNERMDAGDIMLQRKLAIEREDTSETLEKKLSNLGSVLLLDGIRFISEGRVKFKRQDDKKATSAPKLKKEDGLIDWKKEAREIHNMVKGLTPWPCAYTFLNARMLKIWKSEILPSNEKHEAGRIADAEKNIVLVTCGKGFLIVRELQLEGGKRMDAASFLRGHKLEPGTALTNGQY